MPILCAELVADLGKHASLQDTERALYLAFRRLKRRARRHSGHFEYFTFVEISQRGWPRLLLLTRDADISRRWLSENWSECGGARVVNVRPVACLRDLLQTVHLPDFAHHDKRERAESRRNARYSKGFFDGLGADLEAPPDEIELWKETSVTCVLRYAAYRWVTRLLVAVDKRHQSEAGNTTRAGEVRREE